jgi:hypothetical protein
VGVSSFVVVVVFTGVVDCIVAVGSIAVVSIGTVVGSIIGVGSIVVVTIDTGVKTKGSKGISIRLLL